MIMNIFVSIYKYLNILILVIYVEKFSFEKKIYAKFVSSLKKTDVNEYFCKYYF
jgi:hypothetical protein